MSEGKNIYDLELHETTTVISNHLTEDNDEIKELNKVFNVTRVPGGWIYKVKYEDDNGVFVPYVSNKPYKNLGPSA